VVANNNSVRIGKQLVDIPKRAGRRHSYARPDVIVRHQLDGRYRVYFDGVMIGQAMGQPPSEVRNEPRNVSAARRKRESSRKTSALWRKQRG
jgi:hypothetical protein